MSTGPIGQLEGKAIDALTSMGWFKSMTFGQFVICVFLAAFLASGYYGVSAVIPAHLSQIQAGYDSLDKRQSERAATAHAAAQAESAEWRKQVEKQWATLERIMEARIPAGKPGAGLNHGTDAAGVAKEYPPGTD